MPCLLPTLSQRKRSKHRTERDTLSPFSLTLSSVITTIYSSRDGTAFLFKLTAYSKHDNITQGNPFYNVSTKRFSKVKVQKCSPFSDRSGNFSCMDIISPNTTASWTYDHGLLLVICLALRLFRGPGGSNILGGLVANPTIAQLFFRLALEPR